MGRYRVAADTDEDDGSDVEIMDEVSDPVVEPWQERWWRSPSSRTNPRRGGGNNRRNSNSPDEPVQILGSRTPHYDDGSDSDDTVDLTNACDLTGFWKRRRKKQKGTSAISNALVPSNRQGEYVDESHGFGHELQMDSYMEPGPYDNTEAPRKTLLRRSVWALLYLLVAPILAYLCKRAPPPPTSHGLPGAEATVVHHTWGEYLLFSGQRLASVFESTSKDTWYTISGLANNVYNDAADVKENLGRKWKNKNVPCSLLVPSHDPTKTLSTEEFLLQGIVGQDRAMRAIARALDAWEVPSASKGGIVDPLAGCDRDHPTCGKPLVLFVTGPSGVGKAETTRQISRMVYSHCQSDAKNRRNESVLGREVLHLNGKDFASPTELPDREDVSSYVSDEAKDSVSPYHGNHRRDQQQRFRKEIIEHISRRRGAGAIIEVRHIELISPSVVDELISMVGTPGKYLQYEASENVRWDNVLFILSSDLGQHTIMKTVRSYGGRTSIPPKQLEISLRNELDFYLGSTRLGNVVNAVAALMPLGRPELREIVRRKINYLSKQHAGELWRRLDITDAALDHIVGHDDVEYRVMQPRDSDEIFLDISTRGAHTLDDGIVMQTLKGAIRRLDHHPDQVAVFDCGPSDTQALIHSCPDVEARYTSLVGHDCQEVWRGVMD